MFNQKLGQICFAIFLWLVGTVALFAQATGGNITGTITDTTQSTVASAEVSITNVTKGET